jgi:hypothetical protein
VSETGSDVRRHVGRITFYRTGCLSSVASAASAHHPALGTAHWFTSRMDAPPPGPDPEIDPNVPVPDDAAELLPDAPEPLPPAPIESTPDDPGGDPGGVPEPA